MADSEEFRRKRLKHEERLSRVFDEVMGLGEFADSSRGSATSSRSGGQDETKAVDKPSGQEEQRSVEEEDSNGSKPEEKEKSPGPQSSSVSSDRQPSGTSKRGEGGGRGGGSGGGGGGGGAAFDDALDGLPSFGAEEDDEDWHFALPIGSLEDVNVEKGSEKRKKTGAGDDDTRREEVEEGEEEEEEQRDKEAGNASPATSHSSDENTPEDSRDLNQTEDTEDSQDAERSEVAPMEDSNPRISPIAAIKDEPIDEGYDAALLPQSSIRQIKQELEHQEEELKISSVYSVGGGNTFVSPTMPAAVPAPPPTAIFIPSRGTLLQGVAPFPNRPSVAFASSIPSLSQLRPAAPRPPQPSAAGSVRCSGCSKVLLKGQTAFQRKGSTQLFCSTVCLTGHLPPVNKNKICSECNKEITQPRDTVTIPADDKTPMHFCGQVCLSNFKKRTGKGIVIWPEKRLEGKVEKPPEKLGEKPAEKKSDVPFCSVCKIYNRVIEHEVNHQGRVHRLCSNACFVTWRRMRQLAMNCCEGCGLYCSANSSSCQTLTIERSQLNFCGPTCVASYKRTCTKLIDCACCQKATIVYTSIMERDQKGKIQLYCSAPCVEQSRPPQHTLIGAAFPCSLCKTSAVPQYHLAMNDGSIRNFCSYECVSTFRRSGHVTKPELTNGPSSLKDATLKEVSKVGPTPGVSSVPAAPQDYSPSVPYQGHHLSHSSVPPLVPAFPATSSPSVPGQDKARAPAGLLLKPVEGGLGDPSKLTCHQCCNVFSLKPVLLSHQSHISMFCSKACCEQYKTQKNVLVRCESCKQEKVLFDSTNYNKKEVFFCSEGCKLVFKQEQSSNTDGPWRPCTYCSGISTKMLHSHYGGKLKEFCKPHCMSQFTILFYAMGRCDSCRKQGKMVEKLQCLGSVRNFCTLPCLLQYCYLHFEMSRHGSSNGTGTAPQTPYAPTQPQDSSKMNPVIADVVSLANGSATQPSVSANTALTGALPTSNVGGKNLDHASTQTDAMRVPVSRCRQMKNKSVLCRPFTADQEIMCQLPSASTDSTALPIIAPAQIDSSSQPDQTSSADASTSPPPSPEPQGETPPCKGVPARLTGRHFLGTRAIESDCKVCSRHKRKRAEEEEEEQEREKKKRKTEEEEKEEERQGKTEEEAELEKKADPCKTKDCEKDKGTLHGKTSFYCKTCSGEPSLCPVPCFELYHTRLIYKTPPELETQAS